MEPREKAPFHELLRRVVQERTTALGITTPKLAEALGPKFYRSFMYYLNGERHFPAELLPKLCLALKDFRLLNELEEQVGRVAYLIPHVPGSSAADIGAVQKLVQEVGHALEELSRTLEDGRVEKHELEKTSSELDDVIRECAHLKHWLEHKYHQGSRRLARGG